MHSLDDTIAAIATASGGAARGIVRISGADAIAVAGRLFVTDSDTPLNTPALRRAHRITGQVACGLAADGQTDDSVAVPCDLYLWPTARSYTRQPVAELHTFGSPPLLEALLRTICAAGARLAAPGEFTLRAFLAGRIDLVQAEAVLGVIDADDRRQLDVALAQLAGGLTRPLQAIRDQLLDLLADLEAGLDFVEEDIQFVSHEQLNRRLQEAAGTIVTLADQMQSRQRSAAEPRVVLCGQPNAGKSSLFNALVGAEAAIVAPIAGTTRDYLIAELRLENRTCLLIDTAGVNVVGTLRVPSASPRDSATIGAAAESMTAQQQEQADIEIICVDTTHALDEWQRAAIFEPAPNSASQRLIVFTKCDLAPHAVRPLAGIETSTVTGAGCDALKREIHRLLTANRLSTSDGAVATTAIRCQDSLRLAAESLHRAKTVASQRGSEELVAAELRGALMELGKVVGAIYTDDILDRVFSRFCIGK